MNLDRDTVALFAAWYAVFVLSTTLHEAAHAWAAMKLGDLTAYWGGQVSLNPLPHIQREPIGMVVLPILSFFSYGWMMGWASAPYDPFWANRHPRRAALMALAGPLGNLSLCLAAGIAIKVGIVAGFFAQANGLGFSRLIEAPQGGMATGLATLLSIVFVLNLVLFVFNLLPLPPLDGSAVVVLLLPSRTIGRYQEILRQPMFMLMGLFAAWQIFGRVFAPVYITARRLLFG